MYSMHFGTIGRCSRCEVKQIKEKNQLFLCISLNLHYLYSDYEKNRNEKMRNMENPFKFGTIVEEDYFTDRVEEVAYIEQADYRDGSNEHFFKEIF